MASLITPVIQEHVLYTGEMYRSGWTDLLQNESGPALPFGEFADRSIHVTGVFGGAIDDRCIIEGSNQTIPTNWFTLTGSAGIALNISSLIFGSGYGSIILEPTFWIRPRMVGGDGTTILNIWLYLRRMRYRQ